MKALSFTNARRLRTDDFVTVGLILLFLGGIVSAATSAPIEIGQILSEQKLEAQGQCGPSEVTLPAASEYETFAADPQYGNADVSYPCLLDEDFRVVAPDDDDEDSNETLEAAITDTSSAPVLQCIRQRADSRGGLHGFCALALAGPARAPPGIVMTAHKCDTLRARSFSWEGAFSSPSLGRLFLHRHHSRTAVSGATLFASTRGTVDLRLSLSHPDTLSNGRWYEEVGLFRFCGSGKPQSLQRVCAANSTTKTTNNERRYR